MANLPQCRMQSCDLSTFASCRSPSIARVADNQAKIAHYPIAVLHVFHSPKSHVVAVDFAHQSLQSAAKRRSTPCSLPPSFASNMNNLRQILDRSAPHPSQWGGNIF